MNRKPSHKITTVLMTGLLLGSLPVLGGCSTSMDSPTQLLQRRAEIVEQPFHTEMRTSEMSAGAIARIANDYDKHGAGPMALTVTYDPMDKNNTAMDANDNLAWIIRTLGKEGVRNVNGGILPINSSPSSMTIIDYTGYSARMPSGCSYMEDLDDTKQDGLYDYKLGCSTEGYLAQQISEPADLLGRHTTEEMDARKQANTIDQYKWGGSLVTDIEADSTNKD